jgi:hypothetical protein
LTEAYVRDAVRRVQPGEDIIVRSEAGLAQARRGLDDRAQPDRVKGGAEEIEVERRMQFVAGQERPQPGQWLEPDLPDEEASAPRSRR